METTMAPTADTSHTAADGKAPPKDNLETALGAAAEAGKDQYDAGEISADDAGASKLSIEVDRERKLPKGSPPDEDKD